LANEETDRFIGRWVFLLFAGGIKGSMKLLKKTGFYLGAISKNGLFFFSFLGLHEAKPLRF